MNEPEKVYSEATTQKHEYFELITVQDPKHESPHVLIIKTRRSFTIQKYQGKEYRSGSINIRAEYLFGPLRHLTGDLVCEMGGETCINRSVRISNGDILIRFEALRGLKISSFMLNRVVQWAKFFESDRTIHPFKLVEQDGKDPQNRIRRNSLYRRFGIKLIFQDPLTEMEGRSDPNLTVNDLIECGDRAWPSVSVSYRLDGFKGLYDEYQRVRDRLRTNTRLMSLYRRRSMHFDEKLQKFMRYLASIVNWPLLVVVAVISYGLGASELKTYWAALMQVIK